MRNNQSMMNRRPMRFVAGLATAAALLMSSGIPVARADDNPGYTIEVSDVTAKVGEPVVMRATLHPKEGARIMHGYANRVGQLSSLDDSVAFDSKSFPGTDQNGAMVFNITLHPTKPGIHPINGVFRVGYMEGTDYMAMISVQLIAKVTGTE